MKSNKSWVSLQYLSKNCISFGNDKEISNYVNYVTEDKDHLLPISYVNLIPTNDGSFSIKTYGKKATGNKLLHVFLGILQEISLD